MNLCIDKDRICLANYNLTSKKFKCLVYQFSKARISMAELSEQDIVLLASTYTPTENLNPHGTSVYFQQISVNLNGRNQTLLDSCQHGYVIQCAPYYSIRRLMADNDTIAEETSTNKVTYSLIIVTMAIMLLFLVKIIKDKNSKIVKLKRELGSMNETYGKLENYVILSETTHMSNLQT